MEKKFLWFRHFSFPPKMITWIKYINKIFLKHPCKLHAANVNKCKWMMFIKVSMSKNSDCIFITEQRPIKRSFTHFIRINMASPQPNNAARPTINSTVTTISCFVDKTNPYDESTNTILQKRHTLNIVWVHLIATSVLEVLGYTDTG